MNLYERRMRNMIIAVRIADALCDDRIEWFNYHGQITEELIWQYIDESYDIFPRGSADQLAPMVFEIYQERMDKKRDTSVFIKK